MKIVLAMAGVLALSACMPSTATVSDFNGASVKIQTNIMADRKEAAANAQKEADRICATNKKRAEYASSIPVPRTDVNEHLYMCL